MTTKMSSKRSRSRVESDRGPKRGQRNLERARKDKVAKGESWVARDMLRRQAAEAATGLHGSVAEEVQEQKMHEKKAEALPQPEEKQKLMKTLSWMQWRWICSAGLKRRTANLFVSFARNGQLHHISRPVST